VSRVEARSKILWLMGLGDHSAPSVSRGTAISQVMKLLDDGKPRSLGQIAQELNVGETSVYDALFVLYARGGIFRTEKRQVRKDARESGEPPAYHLWTISSDAGKRTTVINGVKYAKYIKRDGTTLSQHFDEYGRDLERNREFSMQWRGEIEGFLATDVMQSMLLCLVSKEEQASPLARAHKTSKRRLSSALRNTSRRRRMIRRANPASSP